MSKAPRSSSLLDQILRDKRLEVAASKRAHGAAELERRIREASPPRGFAEALRRRTSTGEAGIIAEIKKASPSKGVIRDDFEPVAIAEEYASAGATCLSVLTDEKYFQGSNAYLESARNAVELPVLRKDFIVDEYQLLEARAIGADCVLLIVAALTLPELRKLNAAAQHLNLDVLVEVHDREELASAMALEPTLIGINNRNLETFATTLETTYRLLDSIPEGITVVTESGVASRDDVQAMRGRGVHCFLVGEAFMRARHPGTALKNMFC